MRRNILLSFMLLFCCFLQVTAKNGVVVETSSGEKVTFLLDEQPKFSFDGKTVKLTSAKINAEYASSDINKVYFTADAATGIKEIGTSKTSANISTQGEYVVVDGAKAEEAIVCFSADGKLLYQTKADNKGHAEISLASMSKGMIIIHISNKSLKVIKK